MDHNIAYPLRSMNGGGGGFPGGAAESVNALNTRLCVWDKMGHYPPEFDCGAHNMGKVEWAS